VRQSLMPEADIRGHFGRVNLPRLAQLKVYWRVSMRALLGRAKAMRRVSDSAALRLYKQLSAYGGITEPVDIPREHPTALHRLIERHSTELGYSLKDLSELLHQSPDELRAEYISLGNPSPVRLA
jgi:hypothetical protein